MYRPIFPSAATPSTASSPLTRSSPPAPGYSGGSTSTPCRASRRCTPCRSRARRSASYDPSSRAAAQSPAIGSTWTRLSPSRRAPGPKPAPGRVTFRAPDVAVAEHPRSAPSRPSTTEPPTAHNLPSWRTAAPHPSLDVYTFPASTSREMALEKVANVTVGLQRAGVQVAVQPRLAQEVAARHRTASAPAKPRERRRSAPRASSVSATALAASPARAGLPEKALVSTPIAAVRPADPRIAFSCDRRSSSVTKKGFLMVVKTIWPIDHSCGHQADRGLFDCRRVSPSG